MTDRMAQTLEAERRWAMTGTPTRQQNDGTDLRSLRALCGFLRHEPFGARDGEDVWNKLVAKSPLGRGVVMDLLMRVMVRGLSFVKGRACVWLGLAE
jgi:hypothetical protein